MMKTESQGEATGATSDTISWSDILQTLELGCWIASIAMPMMYWISGAAVSRDQAWIRTAMIIMASAGVAISIIYRLRQRWRSQASRTKM